MVTAPVAGPGASRRGALRAVLLVATVLHALALGPTPALAGGAAIATPHPLATDAGADMLRKGGTAFDAAVAAALVMGVTNPQSSGLGGGGFAVFRATDGAVSTLDFREMAPGWAREDSFLDGSRSPTRGAWAVAVPGESRGLGALHQRGGVLPWAVVVEPARALASEGFPVGADLAAALARRSAEILADPGLRADFAPSGTLLTVGQTCIRAALGRTLAYLALHGPDSLHKGPLAVQIAGFLKGRGVPFTEADLAGYRVVERAPVEGQYRGHRILSMGPPSSGGFVVVEALSILERLRHHEVDARSVDGLRRLAAALRHGFADRAAFGADPDAYEVPLGTLLAPATLDGLAAAVPPRGPVPARLAGHAGQSGALGALLPTDGGTAHLSVVDSAGRAVALTSTVNLDFGALIADPQTGILLNDQMDDFAAVPGKPNAFGLVQSARNAPHPGRRPLSSMSPTIVLSPDGTIRAVVGAAGGPRIITGTLQAILEVVDRGADAAASLSPPRLHHQWMPEAIEIEAGVDDAALATLKSEGFTVEAMRGRAVVQIVVVDPKSGALSAAGDPRAGGTGIVLAP